MDLHPEELIDGLREGTLSRSDQQRLDAHLAQCEACRFEVQAARAFEAERVAYPDDGVFKDRVVANVLGKLSLADPPAPRVGTTESAQIKPRRMSPVKFAVVMAAVAATSAAAAALVGSVQGIGGRLVSRSGAPPSPLVKPVSPGFEDEPPARESASAPEDDEPVVHVPRAARGRSVSAAQLFAQANEARRRGRARHSSVLYQRLLRRFPDSREADTSRVALGRLLLDRLGRPDAALRAFDAYLTGTRGGTLAMEARVGRALALSRLGRNAQEAEAWREVIENHPGSPQAERATERLSGLALGRRPGSR